MSTALASLEKSAYQDARLQAPLRDTVRANYGRELRFQTRGQLARPSIVITECTYILAAAHFPNEYLYSEEPVREQESEAPIDDGYTFIATAGAHSWRVHCNASRKALRWAAGVRSRQFLSMLSEQPRANTFPPSDPLQPFAKAFDLAAEGRVDAAIDEINDCTDAMMRAEVFDQLDAAFEALPLDDVPLDLALAFLTATLPVRSRLGNRKSFFNGLHQKLVGQGENADLLLAGLG